MFNFLCKSFVELRYCGETFAPKQNLIQVSQQGCRHGLTIVLQTLTLLRQ